MDRIRLVVAKYAWWIALSWVVAIIVGALLGHLLLAGIYAALNTLGATLYLSAVDPGTKRGRRRWRTFVTLTILQVPAGVVGGLVSPGGVSPTDRLVGDPDTRNRFAFSRMWRGTARGHP